MVAKFNIVPLLDASPEMDVRVLLSGKTEYHERQVPLSVGGNRDHVWSTGGYTTTDAIGRPAIRIAARNTGTEARDLYVRLRVWKDFANKVVEDDHVQRRNGIEPGTTVHLDFVFSNWAEQHRVYVELIQIVDSSNKAIRSLKPNVRAVDLAWSYLPEAERRSNLFKARMLNIAVILIPLFLLSSCIGGCEWLIHRNDCPQYQPYCR